MNLSELSLRHAKKNHTQIYLEHNSITPNSPFQGHLLCAVSIIINKLGQTYMCKVSHKSSQCTLCSSNVTYGVSNNYPTAHNI